MEGGEDRQRIDRWIGEGQDLLGRVIPTLLDDRERLRGKLEAADEECARLRHETDDLRKQVSDLQGETQYLRSERAAIAEVVSQVLEHLGHAQRPLAEVHRRVQVAQPVGELTATA